ncbi:structure-specific endonuclease subunit SLX1 [Vigna unguiculata]|uniref:Structure-specific endonuclease subunit SLX1 n=1 Tax=Vigna unguiculata TaxID=3917 RepID=A0A4D6NMG3_VIGUN|nr:structure-specific endonuclease subunit SLX1 [Vigna unguiculata]
MDPDSPPSPHAQMDEVFEFWNGHFLSSLDFMGLKFEFLVLNKWNKWLRHYAWTRFQDLGFHRSELVFLDARHSEALSLFHLDHTVITAILKSCSALLAPKLGRVVHSYVVKQGHTFFQVTNKGLLNMYAKCSMLDDCLKLFAQLTHRDSVTWNIVLSGFSGSKKCDPDVMRIFKMMHTSGEAMPNSISIVTVIPVFTRLGYLDAGLCVHTYVIKSGFEQDTLVGNALVSMYAKCGLVSREAYAVFDDIVHKDVVSWNAMIAGLAENGLVEDAFLLFSSMLKGPMQPNYATIANILPVCASFDKSVAYHCGRQIHSYVQQWSELSADISVCNALISFYLKIGLMREAKALFWTMDSRDLVTWNTLVAGSCDHGQHTSSLCTIEKYAEEAYHTFSMIPRKDLISWNSIFDAFGEKRHHSKFIDLLHWMLRVRIRPDSVTMLTIIRFCVSLSRVEKVKEIHNYSIRTGSLLSDIALTVGNAILDAYSKCGNMEYANKMFQNLSEKRNLVTCNSLISGYVGLGSHHDANIIFSGMSETDLTTWNLMVWVYAENDCPEQALKLFHALQARGMKPNMVTIMSLLPVCTQMASVHLLSQCHGYIIRSFLKDLHLEVALLDAYAKCGLIGHAYKIFQLSADKDLVMFAAMIGGYAMHGMSEEALWIFSHMLKLGIQPDHIILTSILSACSHTGRVDEGLKIFYSVEELHGMKLTLVQYACVVDLLARGGRISEAYSLVNSLPIEANANLWGTLLGACKTHHEVEFGRIVANQLFKIEANK